jgi:hypothetical protein
LHFYLIPFPHLAVKNSLLFFQLVDFTPDAIEAPARAHFFKLSDYVTVMCAQPFVDDHEK